MEEVELSGQPMVIFLGAHKRYAIIGAGSIGTQVIDSLHNKGCRNIIATRTKEGELKKLKDKYGIEVTTDNRYAIDKADVVVLCVKPKCIKEVIRETRDNLAGKVVISLAAATSLSTLESLAENVDNVKFARGMTGVYVADEIAAYSVSSRYNGDSEVIDSLFSVLGTEAKEVDEKAIAPRTAFACYTGYLGRQVETIVQLAERFGMYRQDAQYFIAHTLMSVAKKTIEGIDGIQISNDVGGNGSLTKKMLDKLGIDGHFSSLLNELETIIKVCLEKE